MLSESLAVNAEKYDWSYIRPNIINVDVGHNWGRGGQKVMTVLFIRENVGNYGRPFKHVLYTQVYYINVWNS